MTRQGHGHKWGQKHDVDLRGQGMHFWVNRSIYLGSAWQEKHFLPLTCQGHGHKWCQKHDVGPRGQGRRFWVNMSVHLGGARQKKHFWPLTMTRQGHGLWHYVSNLCSEPTLPPNSKSSGPGGGLSTWGRKWKYSTFITRQSAHLGQQPGSSNAISTYYKCILLLQSNQKITMTTDTHKTLRLKIRVKKTINWVCFSHKKQIWRLLARPVFAWKSKWFLSPFMQPHTIPASNKLGIYEIHRCLNTLRGVSSYSSHKSPSI